MFSYFSNKNINILYLIEVLKIAIPIIITNLFIPFSSIIDTFVAGKFGIIEIAAVTLGATTFSLIYWSLSFIRMVTTGFTAQAIGRKNYKEISNIGIRTLITSLILGLIILVFKNIIGDLSLNFFRPELEVTILAKIYIDIRIISAPAFLIVMAGLGWLLGQRLIKLAVIIQIAMSVTNILLSLLLGIYFNLGIYGIAYATVISEIFAALMTLIVFFKIILKYKLDTKTIFIKDKFIQLFSANINILFRTIILIFSIAIINYLGARLGTIFLAVNTILFHFQTFVSYGLDGYAHATEILVGRCVGEKNIVKFKKYVFATLVLSIITSFFFIGIYYFFAQNIFSYLTDEGALIDALNNHKVWILISPLISVFCFHLDGVFLGAVKTKMMRNAMIISFFIYLLSLYILFPLINNNGVWLSFIIFLLFRSITLVMYYPRLIRESFH